MSEKRRKQIILAILVLAVVWGIYNQPWKRTGPPASQPGEPASMATEIAPAPVQAAAALTIKNGASAALVSDWTIDPFRGGTTSVAAAVPSAPSEPDRIPVLQGMMAVGDELICVIGGKSLKLGDRIGEWRVVTIAADQVEIVRGSDGRRVTLPISQSEGTRRR